MKLLIILMLSLTFSCKKQNDIAGKAKPAFRFDAFSVNYNDKETLERRKELLHLVYSHLINDEGNKLFANDRLQDISVQHITSIDHDENFAKLIVSYKDKEELYYIPEESSQDWLLNNLGIKRDQAHQAIFIGSKFKKNQTSFLIITKKDEVLSNEIYFQSRTLNFDKVTNFKLEQITKFQKVKIKIKPFKTVFELKEFTNQQRQPGKCFVMRRVVRGGEGGGDVPVPCTCEYKIFRPVLIAGVLEPIAENKFTHEVIVNNSKLTVLGNEISLNFNYESYLNKLEFNLFNDQYFSERIKGIKMNDYCNRDPEENVTLKEELRYEVEVIIDGTSMLLEQLSNLPKVID